MQIRRKVLLLGEEQKEKKCTHQLNKSRCSDNGANSIGQTTDIGEIKRDGRLKISLNCHDNGHRIHTQAYTTARRATPRHATSCHAVRIIKRNYCRAVVNNALLLKCVPASARGYFASCADCVGKSFARARARGIEMRSLSTRSFSAVDLDLTLLPADVMVRPRANQLFNAGDITCHGRVLRSRPTKAAKNCVLTHFGACDACKFSFAILFVIFISTTVGVPCKTIFVLKFRLGV